MTNWVASGSASTGSRARCADAARTIVSSPTAPTISSKNAQRTRGRNGRTCRFSIGSGEKRTLKITARYADHWNFAAGRPRTSPQARRALPSSRADTSRPGGDHPVGARAARDPDRDHRKVLDEDGRRLGAEGLDLAIVACRRPMIRRVLEPLAGAMFWTLQLPPTQVCQLTHGRSHRSPAVGRVQLETEAMEAFRLPTARVWRETHGSSGQNNDQGNSPIRLSRYRVDVHCDHSCGL